MSQVILYVCEVIGQSKGCDVMGCGMFSRSPIDKIDLVVVVCGEMTRGG